jgi:hypothetical protein
MTDEKTELDTIRERWALIRGSLLCGDLEMFDVSDESTGPDLEDELKTLVVEDVETLLGQIEYLQRTLSKVELPHGHERPDCDDRTNPDRTDLDPGSPAGSPAGERARQDRRDPHA